MANFELRIYEIPEECFGEIIEENNIHDISDLNDSEFVRVAEEDGNVFTLRGFLHQEIILPTKNVIRAYFIDVDNSVAKPIRADGLNTRIKASEIADMIWTGEDRVIYKED